MRRVFPVVMLSLLVNFFLFLIMTQMLTGKKLKAKEQVNFRGIEVIDFKRQDKSPKKIKSAKAERLPLPEAPPPLKITALSPPVRPKPVKPLVSPPTVKPRNIVVKQVKAVITPPDPIPMKVPPKPEPIPEKVFEPEVVEIVPPQVEQVETHEITSAAVAQQTTVLEVKKTPLIAAQKIPSSEVLQVPSVEIESSDDVPEIEAAESLDDAPQVPVAVAASPVKKIEATLLEQRSSTLEKPAETLESNNVTADTIEIDVLPLLRTQPRYPRRALRAKLEGMVTIEFTILKDGSVADPVVVTSAPPKVFDRSALRAIRLWKFRPKQTKGEMVTRRAIQNIRFSLK